MEVMEHVDGMQTNLDVLKEMLSGDGYSLPLNTIHGVSTVSLVDPTWRVELSKLCPWQRDLHCEDLHSEHVFDTQKNGVI